MFFEELGEGRYGYIECVVAIVLLDPGELG